MLKALCSIWFNRCQYLKIYFLCYKSRFISYCKNKVLIFIPRPAARTHHPGTKKKPSHPLREKNPRRKTVIWFLIFLSVFPSFPLMFFLHCLSRDLLSLFPSLLCTLQLSLPTDCVSSSVFVRLNSSSSHFVRLLNEHKRWRKNSLAE